MTFTEFQSLCSNVVATGSATSQPCPVVIGDESAPTIGGYGTVDNGAEKQLVVLKEQVPTASMIEILNTCRFSYASGSNETVISPITTGD
jgi:hypothetical protein